MPEGKRHPRILLRMQDSASDAPAPPHDRLGMSTFVTEPPDVAQYGMRSRSAIRVGRSHDTVSVVVSSCGKRVCCVVSGGNVDPALYASLLA